MPLAVAKQTITFQLPCFMQQQINNILARSCPQHLDNMIIFGWEVAKTYQLNIFILTNSQNSGAYNAGLSQKVLTRLA